MAREVRGSPFFGQKTPGLKVDDVVDFVAQMIERGCLDADAVKSALESAAKKP